MTWCQARCMYVCVCVCVRVCVWCVYVCVCVYAWPAVRPAVWPFVVRVADGGPTSFVWVCMSKTSSPGTLAFDTLRYHQATYTLAQLGAQAAASIYPAIAFDTPRCHHATHTLAQLRAQGAASIYPSIAFDTPRCHQATHTLAQLRALRQPRRLRQKSERESDASSLRATRSWRWLVGFSSAAL
jgi:hypothetical protein